MDGSFTEKMTLQVQRPVFSSIVKELQFTASRSSGPGGQHANKVNSKVTLRWNLMESAMEENQRDRILSKLGRFITNDSELILTSEKSRSQLQNKQDVLQKLEKLVDRAFLPTKKRRSTKPTKGSIKRRLENKKKQGEKKKQRKDFDS